MIFSKITVCTTALLASSAVGWLAPTRLARFTRAKQPRATVAPSELSLGAPKTRPESNEYTTAGGVRVNVAVNSIQKPEETIERLVDALDSRLGACLQLDAG